MHGWDVIVLQRHRQQNQYHYKSRSNEDFYVHVHGAKPFLITALVRTLTYTVLTRPPHTMYTPEILIVDERSRAKGYPLRQRGHRGY